HEPQRQRDDRHEGEAEPRTDALERVHRSRKRYPTPRTVWMNTGSRGSCSSFSRKWRTWTSIVRGSRYSAPPQSSSSSIFREKTRPGFEAIVRRSSNSTYVSCTE